MDKHVNKVKIEVFPALRLVRCTLKYCNLEMLAKIYPDFPELI